MRTESPDVPEEEAQRGPPPRRPQWGALLSRQLHRRLGAAAERTGKAGLACSVPGALQAGLGPLVAGVLPGSVTGPRFTQVLRSRDA